ncbi:MAG: tetraacyldisaccharide 4'-kinase [Elusimicrobiota bacterium]
MFKKFFKILFWPLLFILSYLYRFGLWIYFKTIKPRGVNVPVISVGNITLGGTGKTPLVLEILKFLPGKLDAAVLSRGYKRKSRGVKVVGQDVEKVSQTGDEARVIRDKVPNCEVILGADRYRSAAIAEKEGAKVLVLDDGFQSLELKRDLDIVVIDASADFLNDRVLPLGKMREPRSALKRADCAVITRRDLVNSKKGKKLEKFLKEVKPDIKIFSARERIQNFRAISNSRTKPPAAFSGKKVICFSAIGNPEGFYRLLEKSEIDIVEKVKRKDHHNWTSEELDDIIKRSRKKSLDIVTTSKDAVKLPESPAVDGWILEMKLEIEEEFKNYILKKLKDYA